MTMLPRNISKSRFCIGLQCLRRLWWEVHEPDAPELQPGAQQQAIFDRGHQVGDLARAQFPGGTLVEFEPWRVLERIEATKAAVGGGASAIFEASFAAGGVFAAVDVLERRRRAWGLIEVKATLGVKEHHLPDIAVQLYAARAAGLDVRRAELMHLNRECAYPDLDDLFVRENVTTDAVSLLPGIPRQLRRMRDALEGELPNVEPAEQCDVPYECPFAGRCLPELPEHHVSTLYLIRRSKVVQLRGAGIETLYDVSDDAELSAVQRRQVRAVKSNRLVLEDGLAASLAKVERPVAFLDFETINPPVPVWNGCHPYESTPVQMSCHVVDSLGHTKHHAHLADADGDPRPVLADAVVRACGGTRTVVAYNAKFEARCLGHLAAAVPSFASPLRAIRTRLVDLLPIVRDHVYHPAFGGGFGLKAVAPALVHGAGYDDLDVADGDTASTLLEGLLLAPNALKLGERARIRKQLLAYCQRDTELLVRLHERLGFLSGRTA